tara:strand:+ start:2778 stop:3662 length:885 start_codon:yes stop_codon:yes gene_type:complete
MEEILILPSSLETVDFSVYDLVNDSFNLHTNTNEGFKKVPVIWVTAERAYQIKKNKELRDLEGSLVYPIIYIERSASTKDPSKKGVFQANIPPAFLNRALDHQGGSITISRRIQQKKTSEFANNDARRMATSTQQTGNGGPNFVKRKNKKIVYEHVSIPLPVYVYNTYEITIKTEYQEQMNDLVQPFITAPGQINELRLNKNGHHYTGFVDTSFTYGNNIGNISEEARTYETKITLNVIGYLMGSGVNDNQPKISIRENAVEFKMSRERVIFGDIPEHIDSENKNKSVDGGYRE